MQLVEFQGQVGTKDAFAIRAKDLDGNFRRLKPLTNGQYGINETEAGWSLDIFPAYPAQTTETLALTYSGGTLQWRSLGALVEESEGGRPTPESPITAPGAVAPSAISPGANGSLFITTGNASQWSEAPPNGTPAWREVERCDGKTMYVWGTEWED